jgi:hypothetical protein
VRVFSVPGVREVVERFSNAVGCLRFTNVEFDYHPILHDTTNNDLDRVIELDPNDISDKHELGHLFASLGLSFTDDQLERAYEQWTNE